MDKTEHLNFVASSDDVWLNDVGQAATAAPGSTPIGLVSSALNTTISNLFQTGVINSQKQAINLQSQLNELTTYQQMALNEKLATTQDQNQQLQILTNAVAQVDAAKVAATPTIPVAAYIIAGGALVLLIVVAIIVRKH